MVVIIIAIVMAASVIATILGVWCWRLKRARRNRARARSYSSVPGRGEESITEHPNIATSYNELLRNEQIGPPPSYMMALNPDQDPSQQQLNNEAFENPPSYESALQERQLSQRRREADGDSNGRRQRESSRSRPIIRDRHNSTNQSTGTEGLSNVQEELRTNGSANHTESENSRTRDNESANLSRADSGTPVADNSIQVSQPTTSPAVREANTQASPSEVALDRPSSLPEEGEERQTFPSEREEDKSTSQSEVAVNRPASLTEGEEERRSPPSEREEYIQTYLPEGQQVRPTIDANPSRDDREIFV